MAKESGKPTITVNGQAYDVEALTLSLASELAFKHALEQKIAGELGVSEFELTVPFVAAVDLKVGEAIHAHYQHFTQQIYEQLASGLMIPAHLFEGDTNYSGLAATNAAWQYSIDELKAAQEMMIRESAAWRRTILRGWSEFCQRNACPHCGRRPTLCNSGGGDVLHLCQEMFAALKRQLPSVEALPDTISYLTGVALAPFPCMPRAPLQ